jgi:hypothetical protein
MELPPPRQIQRIPHAISRHIDRSSVLDVRKELMRKYAGFLGRVDALTTCVICGGRYRPRTNLLARECFMHTGRLVYGSHGVQQWTCCGNIKDITGCVSCMHTNNEAIKRSIVSDWSNSYTEIPTEILDFKLVDFEPKMVEDYPRGGPSFEGKDGKFYHIRRVAVY